MPNDDAAARRDELAAAAAELKEEVAGLKLAVEQLTERTCRAERASFRTMFAAVILLVVVALLGWSTYAEFQTAARLDAVINNALCPVYALFVGSYDPSTRPLNPDGSYKGSPREKYDAAFLSPQGINAAYASLRCTTVVVPKRES